MAGMVSLLQPKSNSKKFRVLFKVEHAWMDGLKISHRDAVSGIVTECESRFCVVFGRESSGSAAVEQSKRRKTIHIKCFRTFRSDLYRQHLSLAHPQKWAVYQALAIEAERSALFGGVVPFHEQLQAHFESGGSEMSIHLSAAIVDNVIGDLLFHPDDSESLTRQRATALFEPLAGGGYVVNIKIPKRFSMLVGAVALGASFRMDARFVQLMRDETKMMLYAGSTYTLASS
jgi:hypothetical protein